MEDIVHIVAKASSALLKRKMF